MILISVALTVITALLSIPVIVLFIEVTAALRQVDAREFDARKSERQQIVAVIVPAHNESTGILPTIEDVRPQLGPRDRLIVVADNCSDDTAAVAAATGAEVILRVEPEKIGKGYALGCGIGHLNLCPPDFVIFFDADCRIHPNVIANLTRICHKAQRPVQACFLMKTAESSPINHSVAEFAWILKNWVRPLGLRHLRCPSQLRGTGMIFPWDVIASAPLASGNLVEDLKLGLDLAASGKAAHFAPLVIGTSDFPMSVSGTDSQRQRWVQGHIGMLKTVPRFLIYAIAYSNFDLFVLALDLAVPPLSLLGILIGGNVVLTALAALFGLSITALMIATANLTLFTFTVFLAWLRFGRDILSARDLLAIAPLILEKFRLYIQLLLGRTAPIGFEPIALDQSDSS